MYHCKQSSAVATAASETEQRDRNSRLGNRAVRPATATAGPPAFPPSPHRCSQSLDAYRRAVQQHRVVRAQRRGRVDVRLVKVWAKALAFAIPGMSGQQKARMCKRNSGRARARPTHK
eukprot:364393-Chlamydomonas_euryale.AAC.6